VVLIEDIPSALERSQICVEGGDTKNAGIIVAPDTFQEGGGREGPGGRTIQPSVFGWGATG